MKNLKLKGISASLGSGEGIVVHVRDQSDLKKVKSESVIVTDKITTEYTEGFSRCAVVVATKGGITCHAAIICREMRKPCVVASVDAFELLQEGRNVKIDSSALTVSFIEP